MCLLSYFPAGVMPDAGELHNGSLANADGSGYAVATAAGRLITRRTMTDPELLIEMFMDDRAANLGMPAMFHSRFGTGGLYTKYNVHPFTVGSDERTVVAHNGVFPAISRKLAKDNPRSDTRVFAETLMAKQFRRLDRPRVIRALTEYCNAGYTNKVAVITVNPHYRENGYLINATAGVWQDSGAWHSNYDYEPPLSHWTGLYPEADDAGYGDDLCSVCAKEGTIDPVTMICDECQYCQDCREHMDGCQCYTQAAGQREQSAVAGLVTPPAWMTVLQEQIEAGRDDGRPDFASRVADMRETVEKAQDAIRSDINAGALDR